jgi:hypothetical protein
MTGDSDSDTPSLENRVERLERSMAALSDEIAVLRTMLATGPSPASARSQPPAGPRAAHSAIPGAARMRPAETAPRRRTRLLGEHLDLERLLGRYGMLGIAVLAAAAAVGTFLSWAVSRGYLTLSPAGRIIVGLAFAAGIAAWGFRLRKRERSFGSSLLGLSLVVVLVCAYAAGPGLAVVPEWLAFGGAIAVSWALALFARHESDEPLWCVAFGGAAIAPFVTSSGKGNIYGLVVYAASVLIAGCYAIGPRPWNIAWRVFFAAATLLASTAATVSRSHGLAGFLFAIGLPIAAALGGVLPFAPDSRKRAALRWLWILASATGFAAPVGRQVGPLVGGALFAILCGWLGILDWVGSVEQSSVFEANRRRPTMLDWIDAAVLPLSLALQATYAVREVVPLAVAYSVEVLALLVFAWRRPLSATRDAGVAALLILSVAAFYALHPEAPAVEVIGVLTIALAALALHAARPSMAWVAGSVVLILYGARTAAAALSNRPLYTFPPFSTEASFTALCVTIALVIASLVRGRLHAAMEAVRRGRDTHIGRLIVTAAPWGWAFWWGFLELGMSFSKSTSTLLLVVYFAACAVAGVALGHRRHSAGARRTGLALALLAAGTAVYGATSFFVVGMRVLAYLVISAFLLGIAYWYRRPGAELTAIS